MESAQKGTINWKDGSIEEPNEPAKESSIDFEIVSSERKVKDEPIDQQADESNPIENQRVETRQKILLQKRIKKEEKSM